MSREILLLVDALAHEKNVSKEVIFTALELALASATKKKHHDDADVRVEIDRETGEYKTFRRWQYVDYDLLENSAYQIDEESEHAKSLNIGDYYEEPLESIEFGRIGAQAAKQVILQKVREAEREKQYEEYKSKQGEIINGIVKRIEFGNVVVDLGRGGEAILKRENIIRGEMFKVNDRVRAYIAEVNRDNKSYQIVLSRIHDKFLGKLFAQEVPEYKI